MKNPARAFEALANVIDARVRVIMACIAESLEDKGFESEPTERDGDDSDAKWCFTARRGGNTVDIELAMIDGLERDCPPEKQGINFHLNATLRPLEMDGEWESIAGFIPYNYTPEVWVDRRDEDAVQARLGELATLDDELVHIIEEKLQ